MTQVTETSQELNADQVVAVLPATETTVLDENHVHIQFRVKKSRDAKVTHVINASLDFTGVSREQLMQLCISNGVRVALQRQLRLESDTQLANGVQRNVVVLSDIMGAAKARVGSATSAISKLATLNGIDENELRAFIEAQKALRDQSAT